MTPSPDRDSHDPGAKRVVVNMDGVDELTSICQALDGIREDIDWWINNNRREHWLPVQPMTTIPVDPLTPHTLPDAPAPNPSPRRPPSDTTTAPAEDLDNETQFCCESPDLQWTGNPQFPGVACQNCGYIVADCGSVVMQPSPQADPDPEPKEQQRDLFGEE